MAVIRQGQTAHFNIADGNKYECIISGEVAYGPDVYPQGWKKVS